MGTAVFNKFNSFVDALAQKKHNLNSDVLKVILTNSAPVATNTVLANITQIANGNGYTTNGTTTAQTLSNSSGTEKLICADTLFTSVTGNMGPFRYVVLYNSTATNGELIGWYDYGANVTLNGLAAETFNVDFDGTNGVLTLV
jgi:flagellar capping protein FliD